VNICARIKAFGAEVPIIGQIDRLVVEDDCVTIADFKSGIPRDASATPPAYVAQLALYRAAAAQLWPGKFVCTLLVWTAGPRAVELAPDALEAALKAVARRFTPD
jgi:ATP-dependent helicase/nuclease subunit A